MYEVSEMDESDAMSMYSYRTITNDRHFIPAGADLDQIAEQLLAKKSKFVSKLEQDQLQFLNRVKEDAKQEMEDLFGENGNQFELELEEIKQINKDNPRYQVEEVKKIVLADEILI